MCKRNQANVESRERFNFIQLITNCKCGSRETNWANWKQGRLQGPCKKGLVF